MTLYGENLDVKQFNKVSTINRRALYRLARIACNSFYSERDRNITELNRYKKALCKRSRVAGISQNTKHDLCLQIYYVELQIMQIGWISVPEAAQPYLYIPQAIQYQF